MCKKSIYQYPLHEVVWDFGDVAAKSHLCVAPRETRKSPATERALLSSEPHRGGSYPSVCLWFSNTKCFSSSDHANSPASPVGSLCLTLSTWRLGLQCSRAGRSGRCVWAKPLAPAEQNYHWSGRSGAVCFEFRFSCQYCYLPNPLPLQCSSGCFKDLN